MEQPTEITLKNHARAKQIAQGLMEGKTYTRIAKDINLNRNQIHAIMRTTGVRDLIIAEITERETTLKTWIDELHESPNSANKRHAVSEEAKMIRHAKDKAFPSIFRTEHINVNIDLTELQTREHRFTEALNNIPPSCRTAFWEAYNNPST